MKETIKCMNDRFLKLETVVEKLLKDKENTKTEEKRLYDIEKQAYACQQYSRRDSIEIVGIDTSVTDAVLEQKVCDILSDIDVPNTPNEIHACHRLYDGKRTSVKFISRKSVQKVLSSRKKLARMDEYKRKLFINESLCPYLPLPTWQM